MKNKLKLILWGKKLQLPMDYDKLEFDNYELKDKELRIYKNNESIKRIYYYKNGNKWYENNYKNGEWDGKQYRWWYNGQLNYEHNYKNGEQDEKQYSWWSNGELAYEINYKSGIEI